jgi:uncharacterized protein
VTVTLQRRVPASPEGEADGRAVVRRWLVEAVVACSASLSLAVLVALDGTLTWRSVRVALALAAGAAVVLTRDGPPALRSSTRSLLGIVAFVAGAGIGVPHTLAGAWVTGGAGLVALLAGTALLLGVAAGAWTTGRGWRRARVVLVGLVVTQWILFPVTDAVVATNRAPTPPPADTPTDVGLPFRDLTVTTREGIELAAWYVPSTNGAAVVLLHGSGSTRDAVLAHAQVLAGRGFGVLLADARGHGASSGDAMDLGWYGDADLAASVRTLAAQPEVTGRIGAVGLSMGGEEAIGAAASVSGLSAVVAEGVTGRRGADWLPLQPAGPGRWVSAAFYAVQDASAALLSATRPPTDLRTAVLGAAPRPMLIITGGDVPREAVAGQRLHQAAPLRVETWDVPGAAHTAGLATSHDEWDERVGTFLERTLLP